MEKIKELPILNKTEEKNLRYFEIKNLDGIYVGQVNKDKKKWGRGVFINNDGSFYVGMVVGIVVCVVVGNVVISVVDISVIIVVGINNGLEKQIFWFSLKV